MHTALWFECAFKEREKLYIFSSHLGLIRCLTPIGVSAIIYSQAFLDKHRNTAMFIKVHTGQVAPSFLNFGNQANFLCTLKMQCHEKVTCGHACRFR